MTFNLQNNRKKDGMLTKIPRDKMHFLIGEIISLMMLSKVHRKMQIRDIADIILPFINLNQFRIYHNGIGQPVAFVTWAYFSDEIESEYLKGKALLSESELKSGNTIYVTDFIAPYGHTKRVVTDLRTNIFPNNEVKALRFTDQGKHRIKLWKFHGINYNVKLN